jgi:hypothetical protein
MIVRRDADLLLPSPGESARTATATATATATTAGQWRH